MRIGVYVSSRSFYGSPPPPFPTFLLTKSPPVLKPALRAVSSELRVPLATQTSSFDVPLQATLYIKISKKKTSFVLVSRSHEAFVREDLLVLRGEAIVEAVFRCQNPRNLVRGGGIVNAPILGSVIGSRIPPLKSRTDEKRVGLARHNDAVQSRGGKGFTFSSRNARKPQH